MSTFPEGHMWAKTGNAGLRLHIVDPDDTNVYIKASVCGKVLSRRMWDLDDIKNAPLDYRPCPDCLKAVK